MVLPKELFSIDTNWVETFFYPPPVGEATSPPSSDREKLCERVTSLQFGAYSAAHGVHVMDLKFLLFTFIEVHAPLALMKYLWRPREQI